MFSLSLAATLLVGLLPYPIERTAVDPSAPNEDSDYVTVHGLPFYFAVTDSTVAHRPAVGALVRHFAIDWGLAFTVFLAPVILFECVRLAAFYAARGIHALSPKPNDRNA
ncbi:MAG: hypothetical protein ACXWF1_04985 [Chthoniobacterales bacterium]